MRSFIYNNQSLIYVLGVVLFLLVLYFVFKALPTKVSKKNKIDSQKKQEDVSKEEKSEEKKISDELEIQEKTQELEKKVKKEDKKPKIVQIYKREQRNDDSKNDKKTTIDPIYDRNVEFVNTSKNISKFKSFADEKQPEETEEKENIDKYGFVEDYQEDCEFCEDKVKHFDHSRRLLTAIKNDNLDDIFGTHISEKYMNINSDKHLNLNEKFSSNLFARTEKMMANSVNKLKSEEQQTSQKFSLFSDNQESNDLEVDVDDEVKLDMKTALLAETYFNRKRKNKN